MTYKKLSFALIAGTIILLSSLQAKAQPAYDTFTDICKKGAQSQNIAIAGKEGWYFLKSELRSLSVGDFWGKNASKTSRVSNPKLQDPLAAISAYDKTLKKENIHLLIVPIPPKAIIYPDKLPGSNLPMVNPAKRNVLDLKNETCKNREKRNVLKVVARTTKKSSLRWAAFLLFKRQTNGVRIVFKSRRIPFVVFVQHDVCVRGAKIHVRVKLRPPSALKRVVRCAVLAQPLAELYNLRFVRRKIHKRPVSQHLQHVKIIRQPPAHSICPNLRREVRRVD